LNPKGRYNDDSYITDEDYLISRKQLQGISYDDIGMVNDKDMAVNTFEEDYLDLADAVSSNDCTGLMVSGPGFEDELGYYSQVYNFGVNPDNDYLM